MVSILTGDGRSPFPVPRAKILRMPKPQESRNAEDSVGAKPPLDSLFEFSNEALDLGKVSRWLNLADEVLGNVTKTRKKA
jgi:hypothetical protein